MPLADAPACSAATSFLIAFPCQSELMDDRDSINKLGYVLVTFQTVVEDLATPSLEPAAPPLEDIGSSPSHTPSEDKAPWSEGELGSADASAEAAANGEGTEGAASGEGTEGAEAPGTAEGTEAPEAAEGASEDADGPGGDEDGGATPKP